MTKCIGRVREKANPWIQQWESEDDRPKLHFKDIGKSRIVVDSRSGAIVEHDLKETGKRLLEFMDKPKKVNDIAAAFKEVTGFDAAKEIALLQERGLIFQEGERFMSLVLNGDPISNRSTRPRWY